MFMSSITTPDNTRRYDVAILGAGYAGLMAALRLGGKSKTLRVVLINASDRSWNV
jgi:NADH dehydrogenase